MSKEVAGTDGRIESLRSWCALAFLLCSETAAVVGGLALISAEREGNKALAASRWPGHISAANEVLAATVVVLLVCLALLSAWTIWKGTEGQAAAALLGTGAAACVMLVNAWLVNHSIDSCLNRDPCSVTWGPAQPDAIRAVILLGAESALCLGAFMWLRINQADRDNFTDYYG